MQHAFLTMNEIDMHQKRVLIREDFNVPLVNGHISSDARIQAALPGIKQALAANAQVLLMSHLGRPQAGEIDPKFSLRPVAEKLEQLLQQPVHFVSDWYQPQIPKDTRLILFENLRFLVGETENDLKLAEYMASFCDIFVLDAFASAHRAHASTVGIMQFAPISVAGPLLTEEVDALDRIMLAPNRPLLAIIGGAKVSTKFDLLFSLVTKVDYLIVGGGMANTMLAAQGMDVGNSLFEPDLIDRAKQLIALAASNNCQLLLPTDFIQENNSIYDIGAQTILRYTEIISQAKTIIWNGPLGMFETEKFANGTQKIAEAIANSSAFSIAGGGDTITAIEQFKLQEQISYISTGGGAFLEYIEGKGLPAVTALIHSREQHVRNN